LKMFMYHLKKINFFFGYQKCIRYFTCMTFDFNKNYKIITILYDHLMNKKKLLRHVQLLLFILL